VEVDYVPESAEGRSRKVSTVIELVNCGLAKFFSPDFSISLIANSVQAANLPQIIESPRFS
jgi:hypothetical protein